MERAMGRMGRCLPGMSGGIRMKIAFIIAEIINLIASLIGYFKGDMQTAIWHLMLIILLLQLEGKHEN